MYVYRSFFSQGTYKPVGINGTMRFYQLQGLSRMISLLHNGLNGIVADEMVRLSSFAPNPD